MYRSLMLIAAASLVTPCFAQNTREPTPPPADLHPPIALDVDTLRARLAPSQLGLKPQTSNLPGGITLPFGIDYHRDTKGLVVPLDQKSEWGVGVGLNLNSSSIVEMSPSSALGLQPKRAPGVMMNKKF